MRGRGAGALMRRVARRLRYGLPGREAPGWRRRSDPVTGREHALREEAGYWDDWLAARGGKYADEYASRMDPSAEVADPALREVLERLPAGTVSILDVGAGPVTIVGYRFEGRRLDIVATDPLADEYDRSLRRAGVEPPVRTIAVEGERLVERFGTGRFDVAYSRNALDHAVDPLAIIEQMVEVVRPGGHVVLRHVENEAQHQDYVQLHQWNFDERDGELVLWREGSCVAVGEALAGRATLACRREPGEPPWIVALIAC